MGAQEAGRVGRGSGSEGTLSKLRALVDDEEIEHRQEAADREDGERPPRRARLSPGAMTALLDRLEEKGLARRTRDTEDRRRALVEVTPELRRRAAQLYGAPEEGANELAAYTDDELEFLIGFLRRSIAYQEERMRRLDAQKAREAHQAHSSGAAAPGGEPGGFT